MDSNDRQLGMGLPIARRDFIQGAAVAVGGTMLASTASPAFASLANEQVNQDGPIGTDNYPPLRTGMRGQHPGSYEGAHAMRDGANFPAGESNGEIYDLVVVGGGLSGLASAWYFRERFGTDVRVLILDNHDDFGGHAKRNEFVHAGRTLIANGGSSYMVGPSQWTRESRDLIRQLGIAKGHPTDRLDGDLYRSLGLEQASYFRGDIYGQSKLVRGGTCLRPSAEFLAQTPLSAAVQGSLLHFTSSRTDYLTGMTAEQKVAALRSMSYRDYMLNVARVHPDVVPLMEGVWCLGADMASAWFAFFRNRPGFDGLGLERPALSPEGDEMQADDFNLAAGNSDIARLLVRSLIPDSLAEGDFAEVTTKRVNYATLDRPGQPVRIRLGSMAVGVRHLGPSGRLFDPDNSECGISYLKDGRVHQVIGKNVVMACMNNIVPFLVPDLPDPQKAALRSSVRAVNQMTNVLFRNWESFAQAKLRNVAFPSTFFGRMGIGSQRYLGDMVPPRDPSEPMLVSFGTGSNSGVCSNPTMVSELLGGTLPAPGTHPKDQFRMVRAGLLQTPFEHFERAVRSQSAAALSGTDFDPARDILAITVNRWGHGFTTSRNTLFEPDRDMEKSPTIEARQPFGRITIANADAGGVSTAGTAIDEAFRAVRDLEQRQFGFYEKI